MSLPIIDTVAGATPVVELGVGDTRLPVGAAVWDVTEWDDPTSTWSGYEPSWIDITCDVHDIELTVGRDRTMERWQTGSATITVDNSTGWADMGQGPPPEPFELSVRPGRQIRVGMSLDAGPTRWMWRGFIDAAEPSYSPESHDVVTLSCIDAKGEAGKVHIGNTAVHGAGETVAARIGRILDAVDWPAQSRDITATSVTLLATEFGAQAADLLDVAAESGGGAVFGDPRGFLVYRPRDWQTYAPDTPPDATIGNFVGVDDNDVVYGPDPVTFFADPVIFGQSLAGDVCPSGWERSFDRADIATRVIVGRPNEPARPVFDAEPNQVIYGLETVERTDLIAAVDAQLDVLGARWLEVMSADHMPRVQAVTIAPSSSTAARDLAATVDPTIPSRYRCRHRRPAGDVVFDAEFFATGVTHSISRTDWTCRISLDVAAPFAAAGGRWDEGRWDQTLWAEPPVELLEVAG